MDRRADMALCPLTLERTHAKLEYLITGDEKWILSSNVQRCAPWVDKGADAEEVPTPNVHANKVMLCFWSSIHDVRYWEPLAKGSAVTADVYIEQPRTLEANVRNARPRQHRVYFQHCNARQHIAKASKANPMKVGWTILPCPPYSLYLAPSNYHLLSHLNVIWMFKISTPALTSKRHSSSSLRTSL
ncbi:transposase [Ancylostoma ceylanicum]|uniref:Transposase n=1 Tax=Ancylostoma ceylanicum TaxID=53326 RepID=A0A0D6L9I9_9BILA|nr:transposase [Ancylostoma ceylanicum]